MKKRIFAATLVILYFLVSPAGLGQSMSAGVSQISFIDVGQGDAALIQDPNGTDILIDGGPAAAGQTVVDYVRGHTDGHLEVVIVTHADADHSGGLVTLLKASDISIETIYYNGYAGTTQTWDDLVKLANDRSIPMLAAQFPQEYTWGEIKAYILNPVSGLTSPDQNDASVVARIDFQDNKFLFTGDIGSGVENAVVARQTPVAADVLKVAHHGSASSSSAPFLTAVHPAEGVISVGQNNQYGHPAAETLARLASAGVDIWRTDQRGTILVTSDGTQVVFPHGAGASLVYLPLVLRQEVPPPPTPTPTPTVTETPPTPTATRPPPVGDNVQCSISGPAQLCAWVSDGSPSQFSTVTVYGRLLVNSMGQGGQPMATTWHYKTTTPTCSTGITDGNGVASCARPIGGATNGYQVNIDVSIGGYAATTWFTPQ